MVTFSFTADELYAVSKPMFYRLTPDFEISACFDCTMMTFNLRRIAETSKKSDRINIMALILKYASAECKKNMQTWLNNYFSQENQLKVFGMNSSGYSKALLNALDKLRR